MNLRTETAYISRRVRNGLITLAHLQGAENGHDLAQADQTADALIDQVLGEYLDGKPEVVAKETAIRRAIKAISETKP